MPIANGNFSFSVGRDCTLVVMSNTGRLDIPNLMKFTVKQETANIKVDRLDGQQLQADVHKGWTGSFEAERGNQALDLLFAAIESAWIDDGQFFVSTIYQYITECDGSTSAWQYDNVSLKYDDAGDWSGDKSVKQKVSFVANRRRQI